MRATLALAASAALLVASCGGGGSGVSVDTSPADTGVSPTGGPPNSGPDTTTPSITTLPDDPAALGVVVGATGFTATTKYDRPVISAGAEVTNNGDRAVGDVRWTAELLDGSGVVLDDASGTTIGVLLPGQTLWLTLPVRLEAGMAAPADLRVTLESATVVEAVTVANTTVPFDESAVETVSAVPYRDINDELHVEAVFHNPTTARLTQAHLSCGLYDTAGALSATTEGWVYELLPGGDGAADMVANLVPFDPRGEVRCSASLANISTYEPGATGSGLEVQAGLTFNPGGTDEFYDTIVGVTVHNPTAKAAFDVRIDVDLLDAQGRIVEVATPSSTYVLPGETLYTGIAPIMSLDSGPPVSVVARSFVATWGDPTSASLGSQDGLDLTAYPFDVNASAYLDVGLLMFGGSVTNRSTSDLDDAVVSCAALRGGVPVAGTSWTLGETPAGAPTEFEAISSHRSLPAHDEVRCTVHLTAITTITPIG
jgi:hypothetical protein